MKSRMLLQLLTFVILPCQLMGMQVPRKKLSDFDWNGASVLIYTNFNPKVGNYFMLAREKYGADKGTYDAFGGAKEAKDKTPLNTAAREFSEESRGLLGNQQAVTEHMLKKSGTLANARSIIANEAKKFVVYIVAYNPKEFRDLTDNFYKQQKVSMKPAEKEKDMLAHVKESDLRDAIKNAKRDSQNKLITPITVEAFVFQPNGDRIKEKITLRPLLVSTLESFFKDLAYTQGDIPELRIYDR